MKISKSIHKPGKFDYLIENHIVTRKQLDQAIVEARSRKIQIETVLITDFKVSKKHIGKSLSKFYKVKFVEYNPNMPIPGGLLENLKVDFLKNSLWVPLEAGKNKIVVAIDNPHDFQKMSNIKALMPDKNIRFRVALKKDILDMINLFTNCNRQLDNSQQNQTQQGESYISEQDTSVINLVNRIIVDAYNRNASDIHIEPYPGKEDIQVRIRVDGVCALYSTIGFNYKNAIISRIKIMGDLDIAERRKPQDGKIKFKIDDQKNIELRVATVPTQGGIEDIVIRILPDGKPIPLDKLGLINHNYNNFVKAITRPYGIILVCGPTGSGKTTSLHSALGYINNQETKIWTAEDPVEITQKGLRQVQVVPKVGFDFASAMRAFLRADPDVIMIGEMRDKETSSICIKASLTGHLVLSTLHTNSAPESITRLLEMGMDQFNFADAILCILAQRLVRTLCKECMESFHPSREEYNELVREYGPKDFNKNLGILYTDQIMLNRPVGCKKCNNTGYMGRMGLHELLIGTDEIKKRIRTNQGLESIREQASADGMITLKQDGIAKIFQGDLDLMQVRKVCI